jgi:hypothetical protein
MALLLAALPGRGTPQENDQVGDRIEATPLQVWLPIQEPRLKKELRPALCQLVQFEVGWTICRS